MSDRQPHSIHGFAKLWIDPETATGLAVEQTDENAERLRPVLSSADLPATAVCQLHLFNNKGEMRLFCAGAKLLPSNSLNILYPSTYPEVVLNNLNRQGGTVWALVVLSNWDEAEPAESLEAAIPIVDHRSSAMRAEGRWESLKKAIMSGPKYRDINPGTNNFREVLSVRDVNEDCLTAFGVRHYHESGFAYFEFRDAGNGMLNVTGTKFHFHEIWDGTYGDDAGDEVRDLLAKHKVRIDPDNNFQFQVRAAHVNEDMIAIGSMLDHLHLIYVARKAAFELAKIRSSSETRKVMAMLRSHPDARLCIDHVVRRWRSKTEVWVSVPGQDPVKIPSPAVDRLRDAGLIAEGHPEEHFQRYYVPVPADQVHRIPRLVEHADVKRHGGGEWVLPEGNEKAWKDRYGRYYEAPGPHDGPIVTPKKKQFLL